MTKETVTLFLCGDVMTGRGVDQILPHPGDPKLREHHVRDARTYVRLAESRHGWIPWPVRFDWPWGEALRIIGEYAPDVRLINVETSVTGGGEFAPGKGVHYRMNPANTPCLISARPDVCVLANNHVLDFGVPGLHETLDTLAQAGLRTVGAGLDVSHAQRPAVVSTADGLRVSVAACGTESSGVPADWAATGTGPGIDFLPEISDAAAAALAKRAGGTDITVVSLHWGSNWGYDVYRDQVHFAHRLIDNGVDVVYGHSSHHPRPLEIYHRKLILYGCGDLINDYEGIGGGDPYRSDIRLLYFVTLRADGGDLVDVRMVPMRARRMRLEAATPADTEWTRGTLWQVSRRFRSFVHSGAGGSLVVRPS